MSILADVTDARAAAAIAPLTEDDPRFKVAAARRILARGGCESGTAGHVSIRAADRNSFWTSPFEYFEETTPDSLVRASFDLELLEGHHVPSPAIEFHAALYRSRPDIGSVVHVHSHHVCVMATTGRPIGMYNTGSVVFHEEQAFFSDDGVRPPVEGARVVEALGEKNFLLMKNHGAIVVAETVEKATSLTLMLEEAARYHIEAQIVGGTELPLPEIQQIKQGFYDIVVPTIWPATYRRLRRSDPELFAFLG